MDFEALEQVTLTPSSPLFSSIWQTPLLPGRVLTRTQLPLPSSILLTVQNLLIIRHTAGQLHPWGSLVARDSAGCRCADYSGTLSCNYCSRCFCTLPHRWCLEPLPWLNCPSVTPLFLLMPLLPFSFFICFEFCRRDGSRCITRSTRRF